MINYISGIDCFYGFIDFDGKKNCSEFFRHKIDHYHTQDIE